LHSKYNLKAFTMNSLAKSAGVGGHLTQASTPQDAA